MFNKILFIRVCLKVFFEMNGVICKYLRFFYTSWLFIIDFLVDSLLCYW